MKPQFVADLKPGGAVNTTFLVQAKDRRLTRTGSPYLDLVFRDSTGSVRAKLWDSDRFPVTFEVDDVVQVIGTAEDYQGNLQLSLTRIGKAKEAEVDLLDFLPRTRNDPEVMYAALVARVEAMASGPLRQLLLNILTDPAIAPRYKLAPAATVFHHAFLGGLIEHVTSLCGLADLVCPHYPFLDPSLVLAGLLLHDVGKIEELTFTRGFRYSTRGLLLGHINIAVNLIETKTAEIEGFPPLLRDQLQHIVLSHHGKPEFGSPREPMFPEAFLVHILDNLDSKLESMRAQYEAEKNREGDWTTRNRALGVELLRAGVSAAIEAAAGTPQPESAGAPASQAYGTQNS